MRLKIRIQEKDYVGSPVEILDQLRVEADRDIPTVGAYIRFVQDNIQRTGNECTLDGGSTEKRALSLLHRLEGLFALEIVEDCHGG